MLRIDDLDPPRAVPGAADAILRCLDDFGMQWDEDVVYQSMRGEAYLDALDRLRERKLVYGCRCSRKDVEEAAMATGIDGPIYPGTCRDGTPAEHIMHSLRLRTDDSTVEFEDRLRGRVRQQLAVEIGDFVLRRADGAFSYHLACVVDDAAAGITHVVRGADLIDSTPRQIYLQRLLGLPTPGYLHLPIAVNANGEKLSKQTLAQAVDSSRPAATLARILQFLGQSPPPDLAGEDVEILWSWGIENWRPSVLPREPALAVGN